MNMNQQYPTEPCFPHGRTRRGFSLVELLIVIGIIAVLGGVMLTQFSGSTDSALAASCMNNMRTLCNAVLADASMRSYYPSAGPYQYYKVNSSEKEWFQGWIGHAKGETTVSCYYSDKGEQQHYAITNGSIWRATGGQRGAYVCPAHTKYCKNGKHPSPAWSYVMNSYFGWDISVAAGESEGRRSYGDGLFTFRYNSSPTSRKRAPEKVLLFAEIPFVENGVQQPEWSTSASDANDMILKYAASDGENQRMNKADSGAGEAIGFNHKSGKNYSAHVAFADGHCVKLMLPDSANEDNLKELTSWLCKGMEYTFNGSVYSKVSE